MLPILVGLAAGFWHSNVARAAPDPAGSPVSADEVRAIVAQVLADAEGRSSLAGDDAVAGFDGRFFLADPASGFRVSMTGEYQARYLATFGAEEEGSGDDGFESGFQVQNVRLDFRGKTQGDLFEFRVMPAYERGSGDLSLLDAYVDTKAGEFRVRFGQFAIPFTREFIVSPTRQVGADRSVTDMVFRLNRSQGVMVMRDWDRVRVTGALTDGARALNTDYDNEGEADIAVSGRGEVRVLDGAWKQYDTAFARRDDVAGLLAGLAGHWQRDGRTSSPSAFEDDADLFQGTCDLTWKAPGWTIAASGFARHVDGDASLTDFGVMAHASVVVAERIDVFARYAHLWPDGDRPGGSEDFSTVEAGGSWSLVPGSPVARITAQVVWAPDAQGDSASIVSAPNTSAGILPDDSGGQVTFLVQVQVVF
jgi:hypothetical protein